MNKVGIIIQEVLTSSSKEYYDLVEILSELIDSPDIEIHISYDNIIVQRYLSKQHFRNVVIHHINNTIIRNPYNYVLKNGGISIATVIDSIINTSDRIIKC